MLLNWTAKAGHGSRTEGNSKETPNSLIRIAKMGTTEFDCELKEELKLFCEILEEKPGSQSAEQSMPNSFILTNQMQLML